MMCEHVRLLLNLPSRRVVESLDQLHPALQKFVVRNSLPRPALEYLVHSVAFLASETVVQQVRVVNDLSDYANAWISHVKLFCQGFKRTVIAAMSEPFFMEHVVRHSAIGHTAFRRERKPRFTVNKLADHPSGGAPIDAWSWSRLPNSAFVLFRIDLGVRAAGLGLF